MAGFVGFVALNATIDNTVVARNSSQVPTDPDAAPTFRIYGQSGFLDSGSLTTKDSKAITGASNANPTVITSVGHNLTTGVKVTISGVGGNTGANGTFDVTVIDSNTFSIAVDTSLGSAYTSGGTWKATGVLDFNYSPTVAKNFASGSTYSVLVYGKFSSVVTIIDTFTFTVT